MNMNVESPKNVKPVPTGAPKKKPTPTKENIMTGGETSGVPEFENLMVALDSHLEALETLKTFEASREWQHWHAMELQPHSEAREAARAAVLNKLDGIERILSGLNKDAQTTIEFFKSEVKGKA